MNRVASDNQFEIHRFDTLAFQKRIITGGEFDVGATLAEILINGKPLPNILYNTDKEHLSDGNGDHPCGYDYISPETLYRYLKSKRSSDSPDEVALMECPFCHMDGCSALLATVKETDDAVIWHNIHKKSSQKSKPSDFPSFRFEKNAYNKALKTLLKL